MKLTEDKITVGIPSVRPQNLLLSLPPLIYQESKPSIDEMIIVMPHTTENLPHILELLEKKLSEKFSIRFVYEDKGIGLARSKTIEETNTDYLLFLDDDILLSSTATIPNLFDALHSYDVDFVNPLILNPKDEKIEEFFGDSYITPKEVSEKEAHKIRIESRFNDYYNPLINEDRDPYYTQVGRTDCILINLNHLDGEIIPELKKLEWKEDIFLTGCLGRGLIHTKEEVWHLFDTEQTRDWGKPQW